MSIIMLHFSISQKYNFFVFAKQKSNIFYNGPRKIVETQNFASLQNHSFRSDFTGFTVAALNDRKVTTEMVTPNTATNAKANTHTCSGTL